MRNRFDRQLSTLNDELIEMGSMIEKSIETAIKALVNQDVDLARHAIEADEEIDRQERIIEDLCLKLLLQQQPVAKDLRLISSALKMITDMATTLRIFQKSQLHWQTSRILRNWSISSRWQKKQ